LATPSLSSPVSKADAAMGRKWENGAAAAAAVAGKGGGLGNEAPSAYAAGMGGGFGAKYVAPQADGGKAAQPHAQPPAAQHSSWDIEIGSIGHGNEVRPGANSGAAESEASEVSPLEEWHSRKPLLGLHGARLPSAPSGASSVLTAAAAAEAAGAAQNTVDGGWKANYVPDIEASMMKQYLTNLVITQVCDLESAVFSLQDRVFHRIRLGTLASRICA
jgi:hypothetical protein